MASEDISVYTGEKRTFGTVDYVLFSLMFVASAAIGFYHAVMDRRQKSEENFHLGGRKMHPVPVSLSLSATFLSTLTILGTPAEIYTNGTMYFWIVVGMFIAIFLGAHLFIPVFFNLNKTSCFEYLELRFGRVIRMLASIVFILQTLVYMAFVLYAPSLAFEAVTGISLWGCMVGAAAVCTLYTTLGGMKTVLWTDSLQFTIIIAGLLCLLIEGSSAVGGFSNAWSIADEAGRIQFTDFSADPKVRHSVWTVAIGGSFFWMYLYGVNQAQVQRACSLPSLKKMKLAFWLNYLGLVIVILLTCMIGVVMYAIYRECHPVKYGIVNRNDQLIPLLVLDVLGKIPGLSGVFMACVFSGGLSTVSSGLNAMSAVFLEDFIKPCFANKMTGKTVLLSKVIVIATGLLQFGFAVGISRLEGLIMQLSYSLYSVLAGPLFGIFVAGMFFPWTNQIGSVVGFLLSLAFMAWLCFGAIVAKPSGYKPLPVSVSGCNWNTSEFSTSAPPVTTTSATILSTVVSDISTEEPILHDFYRMSYQWYTGLGMIINVVISLIVSFLTGYSHPEEIDCRLMCPFVDRLFPYLPESIRKPFRFGVVYKKDNHGDTDNGNQKPTTGYDNSAFVDGNLKANENEKASCGNRHIEISTKL